MRSNIPVWCAALAACGAARADLVNLVANHDATLYYDPAGALASGSGDSLFAGLTGSHGPRRALLSFDVAGAIPAGSTINSVSLRLLVTRSVPVPRVHGLHAVLASWGEGASNAGSPGGAGTAAAPNDATWAHRFYNTTPWTTPGGDFDPAAVSSLSLTGLGSYTWPSSGAFVSLTQSWLNAPAANFGLLIVGDEVLPGAKRFASREYGTASARPTLIIDYTPVPAPPITAALVLGILVSAVRRRGSPATDPRTP